MMISLSGNLEVYKQISHGHNVTVLELCYSVVLSDLCKIPINFCG